MFHIFINNFTYANILENCATNVILASKCWFFGTDQSMKKRWIYFLRNAWELWFWRGLNLYMGKHIHLCLKPVEHERVCWKMLEHVGKLKNKLKIISNDRRTAAEHEETSLVSVHYTCLATHLWLWIPRN